MNIRESDLDQLINDPHFRRYVLSQALSDSGPWQQWLVDNPDRASAAIRVRALLRAMQATQRIPPPELVDREWVALVDRLDQSVPAQASPHAAEGHQWDELIVLLRALGIEVQPSSGTTILKH